MALAQSIYLVGGRPALAASYLVARAQQTGAIRGAPVYRTEGAWPEIAVTASVCTPDGVEHSATVSMQEAREDGWAKRNPKYASHRPAENMLCHRAAARLIRRVAPGVVLGMSVAEEAEDTERATVATLPARAPRGRAALLGQAAPEPAAIEERTIIDTEPIEEREVVPVAAEPSDDEKAAIAEDERRQAGEPADGGGEFA